LFLREASKAIKKLALSTSDTQRGLVVLPPSTVFTHMDLERLMSAGDDALALELEVIGLILAGLAQPEIPKATSKIAEICLID
jgi:hypothetical protein